MVETHSAALDAWEEALALAEAAEARVEDAEAAVRATRNDRRRQALAEDELRSARRELTRARAELSAAETRINASSADPAASAVVAAVADAEDAESTVDAAEEPPATPIAAAALADETAKAKPRGKDKEKDKEKEKTRSVVARPELVRFADFDVGESYTQQVVLHNVSAGTCTLRPQADIGPALRECLRVVLGTPQRVPAGGSCAVTLEFTPKTNEDLADVVSLVHEGGKTDVAVECATKKCEAVASTQLLDFANVAAGSSKTLSFTLTNQGALPSAFSICTVDAPSAAAPASAAVFSFQRGGELQPYSDCVIDVGFAPKAANASFAQRIRVEFAEATATPIELAMQGSSVDLPIYIDTPVVDFKVCCVDELYRESLVINNRGKTALRVAIELPHDVARELQPQPVIAFVQAGSSQAISLKLRPSLGLLKKYRRTALPKLGEDWKSENAVEINGILSVPGQTLPVHFSVRAQVSETNLQIDPKTIDFGRCPLDSSVSVLLKITNPAIISQRIGFLNTPGDVQISPADGFLTLAPHETLALKVVLSPRDAGEHMFTLVCATLRRKYEIPCRIIAAALPVRFRQPIMHLAPFAPGGAPQSYSAFLENTSATAQGVEIIPPPGSFLMVEPTSAILPAKTSLRVKVSLWSPRPEAMPSLPPSAPASVAAAASSTVSAVQAPAGVAQARKQPQRARGKKAQPEAPAPQQQQVVAQSEAGESGSGGGSQVARRYVASATVPSDGVWLIPCYIRGCQDSALLEVHTSFRQAPFSVSDPAPLDFGKVPAAQHADKSVRVKNLGNEPLRLALDPLDDSFVLLHGPRKPLDPGDSVEILLRFVPHPGRSSYFDVLRIRGQWHTVDVPLVGECEEPDVAITPATTKLSLGPTMAGVPNTTELKVQNNSAFAVSFSVSLRNIGPSNNSSSAKNAFSVEPRHGKLSAGASATVTVRFAPDHERDLFHDVLDIVVLGSDIKQTIHLEGQCTGMRGMFVVGPRVSRLQAGGGAWERSEEMCKWAESDYIPAKAEHPPESRRGTAAAAAAAAAPSTSTAQALGSTVRSFELVLDRAAASVEPAVAKLVIGNATPPQSLAAKPATGELIIEPLSQAAVNDGFSFEWSKTPLEPGTQRELVFKYMPPPTAFAGLSGAPGTNAEAVVQV